MCEKIKKIVIFAALLGGLGSCGLEEFEEPVPGPVTFTLQMGSEDVTKSSYAGDESTVNNFKVFIYQSGMLVDSGYSSDGSMLPFTLSAGSYDFYAICNVGDVSSLGSSPDDYRYSTSSTATMLSGGIPMAGKKTAGVTASTTSVTVDVTRLVAKYSLYVQRNFSDANSSFTVTGVKVCQVAGDALAFGSGSVPGNILPSGCGDYASTSDISCLNAGTAYNSTTGAVSFYMLENARGTLLSGNTDPWKKCYDSYGGLLSSSDAAKCTYLEVSGIWALSGVQESITYRMFLGNDNCTNFDVLRNTQSVVTLILTDEGKYRSSWKVENQALGGKINYTFSKNYYDDNAKWVYSNCPCVLDFGSSSLERTVTIKYAIYDSTTGSETSSTDTYSVYTSTVRSSTFYFDPSVNRAYYYNSTGTGSNGHTYYLRVYLNGTLREEHEIHQLWSWFVPTGNYVYSSSDFLDQSDEYNPPTLFVTNKEQVELKVYDPVDHDILSPKLLYLPQNFTGSGSKSYTHLLEEWDWNDMDENGITYDMEEEDPEDHNLTFTFTKTSNGETSYWNLGYNYTAQNACLNIQTAGSIPSGGVTEVNVTMPLMLDNACAGSTTGQSTVAVDFSPVISSNPNSGPGVAPLWLKFDDISSFGYLPSYNSGNPEDPYGLSISYGKTSNTTGQLTFRKSFCGSLVLYWEDVTYGSTGKVGYRYKFTFLVRPVFDIGVIYVPVYLPKSPDTQYTFSPILGKVSTYYENTTNKGIIRMYPLVKDGTNGAEVFGSLISHMKMKDYYTSPYGSYQWMAFSDVNAVLHESLLSARVSSVSMGSYDKIRVTHGSSSVADVVGSYDWTTSNTLVDGEVIQTYIATTSAGHLVVTSSVTKNTLNSNFFADGVCLRRFDSSSDSPLLMPGDNWEVNDGIRYFKIKVVNEFYNDRFDAWPWNKIVYE